MADTYSSMKIFHHKEILDAIERGERTAPIYIRLKPTNICNQHCSYCTYGSGDTTQKTQNRDNIVHSNMIPWEKFKEIVRDMGKMGVKAVTLSGGGEPLTYPNILDAVKLIKSYNIDLSLISNGMLLKDELAEEFCSAKWVRISFDHPEAEGYMKIRNVSEKAFQQVCDNIRSFSKNKKSSCVLGINFVISKANYDKVYQAALFLKELGVNNVKFAALVSDKKGYHLDIKDEVIMQIHRAKIGLENDSFQIINNYESDWMDKNFTKQPFKTCYSCRMITTIAADQCVYLCHTRAYDSGAMLGSIKEQSFQEMWFSKVTNDRLNNLDPQAECRNYCAYQDRNQMMNAYFNVNYDHLNFI